MGLAQVKQTDISWESASPHPEISSCAEQQLLLLQPITGDDLKAAAGHLRQKHMVLINLEKAAPAQSRRMTDYLGGMAYGLHSQFYKVSARLYLLLPGEVELKEEDFLPVEP